MQSPRALPRILADKEATAVFLKKNATEAKKVLSAKEVSGFDELAKVPLLTLLDAVNNRLDGLEYKYVQKLRSDVDEDDVRQAIFDLRENVSIIIEAIEGK